MLHEAALRAKLPIAGGFSALWVLGDGLATVVGRLTLWENGMSPTDLAQLLKLPPGERAELAMVLWESLTEVERDSELSLDPGQRAELDRRWADHLAEPGSAVPGDAVRQKLRRDT